MWKSILKFSKSFRHPQPSRLSLVILLISLRLEANAVELELRLMSSGLSKRVSLKLSKQRTTRLRLLNVSSLKARAKFSLLSMQRALLSKCLKLDTWSNQKMDLIRPSSSDSNLSEVIL